MWVMLPEVTQLYLGRAQGMRSRAVLSSCSVGLSGKKGAMRGRGGSTVGGQGIGTQALGIFSFIQLHSLLPQGTRAGELSKPWVCPGAAQQF